MILLLSLQEEDMVSTIHREGRAHGLTLPHCIRIAMTHRVVASL